MSSPSIVRNIFSNWGSLLISVALAFVTAPIVVRSLGDTWYGLWGITMQFSGFLWLLDLGIRDSVVRYVAKNEAARDQDTLNAKVSVAIYLYVAISVATLLVGVVASEWGTSILKLQPELLPTARVVILLTAVNMSLTWLLNPFIGMLMGLQRYDLMNAVGVSVAVARFVGTVAVLAAGIGIIGLSILQIAATVISAVATYALCLRVMPAFRMVGLARSRRELGEVWRFSFYIVLNNLASKIVFATDSLVIGSNMPVSAVTYFAIPSSLVQHLANGMRSMSQVFYPRSSSLEGANDKDGIRRLFLTGAKYSMLVGLSVACVLLTLGADFIRLWIGTAYGAQGETVLTILTVMSMLTFSHYTVYYVLLGVGRQRSMALLRVAEAILNLALSLVLVRRFGITGVAIGTAVPHVASMVFVLPFLTTRDVGVSLREYYSVIMLWPLMSVVPAVALGYSFHILMPAQNFVVFCGQAAATAALFVVVAFGLALTAGERRDVAARVASLLKR